MAINEEVFKKFKMLAAKLNNHEFKEITELIYYAHMGCDIGYADDDCLALLADAKDAKRKIRAEQKQKLKLVKTEKIQNV